MDKCLALLLLISVSVSGGMLRQPPAPAWSIDLTDSVRRTDGVSLLEMTSRKERTRRDCAGKEFDWILSFRNPEKKAPHGYLLLLDCGEIISEFKVNGKKAEMIRPFKPYWRGAETAVLLPEAPEYTLQFHAIHLTSIYPNAFGRITLRPATINDVLTLSGIQPSDHTVRVINRGFKTENFDLEISFTDFFGRVLKTSTLPLVLRGGSQKTISLPVPREPYWKVDLFLKNGLERSFSYRHHPDPALWYTARSETLVLRNGWERCAGGTEEKRGPLPRSGWKPAGNFPLEIRPKEEKSHILWLRTRQTVPASWKGQQIFLAFPTIHFQGDVFINGREIGSISLWETPGKLELSRFLKPGETFELAIGITDYIATLLPGTPIPPAGIYDSSLRTLTAAVGHFPAGGYAALKTPPVLLAEPEVRTEFAFIKPRVSGKKSLDLELELVNHSGKTRDVTVECEIFQAGKKVHAFRAGHAVLKPGTPVKLKKEEPWSDPELWTPETPVLYELRITLRSSGETLDVRRERFGFREITIDGPHFKLNGEKFTFFGFSQTYPTTMFWPMVPQPQTLCRYHFHTGGYAMGGIEQLHLADELGIFVKSENLSHNAHHGERFAYQSPLTWERLYQEMYHVFRATCNSPANAFWDIGNECYFGQPGEAEKMGDLFARISAFDPTRPVTISGSIPNAEGPQVKVLDRHGECDMSRTTDFFLHPEKRPQYMKNAGRFSHIPENENPNAWEKGKIFSADYDTNQYAKKLLHFDNKVIFFSESMYMHTHFAPGLNGNSIYSTGPVSDYMKLPLLSARRYMIRRTRTIDPAAVLGHLQNYHGKEISPQAAFLREEHLRFRSGERLLLTCDVFNWISRQDTIELTLTLKDNGRVAAERKQQLSLSPYESRTLSFDFGTFSVREDRKMDLLLTLRSGSGAGYADWEEIMIYQPNAVQLPQGSTLSIFDPGGQIVQYLSSERIRARALKHPMEWGGGEGAMLIVGPDALTDPQTILSLSKRLAEQGGSILVLSHDRLPDLTSGALETTKYSSTDTYPLYRPDSPLYGAMEAEDLRFWNTRDNDLRTVTKMIRLPASGNFRLHTAGAYSDGIKATSTAMLDYAVGKGIVRYCQFNLERSLRTEPAAAKLFHLLLTRPPEPFAQKDSAVLLGKNHSRILRGRAGGCSFASNFAELNLEKLEVLVMDSSQLCALKREEQEKLKQFIFNGGSLLFFGADTSSAQILSRLSGTVLQFRQFALDRARFITEAPLIRGIDTGDLFWQAGKSMPYPQIRKISEETPGKPGNMDPGHWILTGRNAVPLTKPAYLSRIPFGKGEITICTLRLFDSAVPEAERLLSMLLTNAGVRLTHSRGSSQNEADREASEMWNYTPVDLSSYCNRGFRDSPDAPVRGWSAQGPEHDLRNFPVGKQIMRGVTFDIVDPAKNRGRSLIALSGTREIGTLPASVEGIRVGRRFERIVFQYGSAWGAPEFTIRVNYADRKKWIPGMPDPYVDILFRPGLEINDWYHADTYLKGGGSMPRAKLAWSGYTLGGRKIDRHVGTFLYEWDNPFPEKEIESIDILSPGKKGNGQLFILGISGANRRKSMSLEKLLPEKQRSNVFQRQEWSGYGIVVAKNGSVPLIYRTSDGEALFSQTPWLIQGQIRSGNKIRHTYLDGASARTTTIRTSEGKFHISSKTEKLKLECTIELDSSGVTWTCECEILQNPPEGTTMQLIFPVVLKNGHFVSVNRVNPLQIEWNGGLSGALEFPRDFQWHNGYYGDRQNISFTPFPRGKCVQGMKKIFSFHLTLP